MGLEERLEALGRELAEREVGSAEDLQAARSRAEELRADVVNGLSSFHAAIEGAGAGHLRVQISTVRVDDKHVRSCEFELRRGHHCAIVTVKSRGEVTLVGPFRAGKQEGPCLTFPLAGSQEFAAAFEDFLVSFLTAAAAP